MQIITPVRLVSSLLATTQQARAGAERVFELLDLQPRVADAPDARPVVDPHGAIELDHVSFHHVGGPPTLRDISLRIRPGERIGIVGASGSGKSTLAFLIARFYDPTTGSVRLDGTDLRRLTLESLRSTVNVVFEESFLFSTTIRRQHRLRPAIGDRRRRSRRRRGSPPPTSSFSSCTDGYDTVVGERGFTLSGGQRQRIALARAALANPQVLVLDDATSAIDAHTEERIHDALADELGSRTTVLIAHRSSTLRLADRVIVLDRGRIVAEGTNAELWHTSELYRELLRGPNLPPVHADAIVDDVDPEAWPIRGADEGEGHHVELASIMPSMMTGGGGGGALGVIGTRAGLVAATPELLARVDALPPLSGDPDVDLVEATDEDGRSSVRRLARRFRWAFLAVAGLVFVDAGHDAGRAVDHPSRHRRRCRRARRRGAGGDVRRLTSPSSC